MESERAPTMVATSSRSDDDLDDHDERYGRYVMPAESTCLCRGLTIMSGVGVTNATGCQRNGPQR